MTTLNRDVRRELERTVINARNVAEAACEKALESLAVGERDAHGSMTRDQKALRNRLRAHGRQLGDSRNSEKGTQDIDHLVAECAYDHWHRMLFARFLAENDLLLEPAHGVSISIPEVQELARERGQDWVALASEYAVQMLPQVFRQDDPVLEVTLAPEDRKALEELLESLPVEVFTADDSLGWTYQFWQTERKEEVNASGNKIGADELPAVTQLFTEHYMVDFLLDNTLGGWHAGRALAANPSLAASSGSERELRQAVALLGVPWSYLRFIKRQDGSWAPAAGTFDGWPKTAKELTCLDPCMGSGHFLVAMFERLVALRMAEEGLDESDAVAAVIRDNLFGLEIDPRCTQIGAFNLALAAWRRVGHCTLPAMNLACSGLAPNTREADWLAIAGDNEKLRNGMERLYRLFKDAPVLGSLINPRAAAGDLLEAGFHELQPLLEKALAQETKDDTAHEMAVTARGLAKAAEILAGQFTLVATNVPYIGQKKQDAILKDFCERTHPKAKGDLATCFLERCLESCAAGGSTALVTPHNWLFLGAYSALRRKLLSEVSWDVVARLGAHAFETISGEVVNVALVGLSRQKPSAGWAFVALDVADNGDPLSKAAGLVGQAVLQAIQADQLRNPDLRISFGPQSKTPLLAAAAISMRGIVSGDGDRWFRQFWELPVMASFWRPLQTTVRTTLPFGGRDQVIDWSTAGNGMLRPGTQNRAYTNFGVALGQVGYLPATLYCGELYDNNTGVIVPLAKDSLPALWAFCSSELFAVEVRRIDQALKVTNATFLKIPFDLGHWRKVAAEEYPQGLPKPFSSDPTQWLFNGHPRGSDQPLHVAVARLLGYQWPRQTGSSFPDCPSVGPDGLESHADADGIVCLASLKGEEPAEARLRKLLAGAYGNEWSATKQAELLAQVGFAGRSLDDWLREKFFEQHCSLFDQRPFIWHIWDGQLDGFHALLNYHKLAASDGEGRRTLEKLTFAYLGDWIARQQAEKKAGKEGAEAKLAAALHLQEELKKILAGEPPYDIFVRWKPLHEQPIGWEPDINDGVRLNIRPFLTARSYGARSAKACILRATPRIKWDKDRGKEPQRPQADFPWFWGWDEETEDFEGGHDFDGNRWNDVHYKVEEKQAARERHAAKKKGL